MSAATIGVIFDLDGVLIDSEDLQFRAYTEVLARFGVAVTREEYAEEWIAKGCGPEYAVAAFKLPLAPAELRALKNPVYHRILQQSVTLMPGARAALARLAAHYPLALATNSNETDTAFVLDRFALRSFFTAVITRGKYERPKPAPDAFLTAAATLGLPPARCLVIEDAHKGVVAAHRAGARCVAIPHAFTAANDFSLATRLLHCLDELTVELVREMVLGC